MNTFQQNGQECPEENYFNRVNLNHLLQMKQFHVPLTDIYDLYVKLT